MAAAWWHHGLAPMLLLETCALKVIVLGALFAVLGGAAIVGGDALTFNFGARRARAVVGGVPCQPLAPNGNQLGLADHRAAVVTRALPRAAAALDADCADAEEHHLIVGLHGGAVLRELDAAFDRVGYVRVAADVDNAIHHGAPSWRNRAALRWEKRRMRARLGPCPALGWVTTPT